jgi:serine/threonine protein kinase
MKYCDACHTTYPNEFQTCPKDQSVLRAISELRQGMVIRDKYQIMEKIGAGGMAVVYKARHLAFNELRAIKVVNSRLLDDDAFIRRFKSEAIITRKLMHPNAVRVDDLDSTEDGRPFMVMEYVHGKDLRHLIQREGPLGVRRAINIARQVCSALSAAHALGITHRDIKPDNILITDTAGENDAVKVLDFGIAKIREAGMESQHSSTKTGMVVGTPQYISPEQAMGRHGEQIDGRADLYSLGVVLYEMVTGRLPFESDTPMGLLLHHIQSIAPPAHELTPELRIPESLSLLLVRALEKDRMLRFQSAEEMVAALEAVDDQLSTGVTFVATRPNLQAVGGGAAAQRQRTPTPMPRVPTPAPPQPYQYQKTPPPAARPAPAARYQPPPKKSNAAIYVISAVVLLALVGGIYYYLRPAPSSAQASDARTYASPDEKLVADVRSALANSSDIKSNIDVSAQAGVVTLKGKIGSLYEQQMAESLTKGVAGVKDVVDQTDYQKVSPVVGGDTSTPASETPAPEQPRSKPQKEKPQEKQARGPSAADKAKARSLVSEGNSEADNGEYNAAIGSYQQALELDPGNTQASEGLKKAQKAKATEDEIMRRR